jgi:hypothetical protein
VKKRWERLEERTARDFGGRRQPGSGSQWNRKGDVVTPILLIENKYRGNNSLTLKALALQTICDQATAEGRVPALVIELDGREYVLFTKDDVLELFGDRVGAAGLAGPQ